MSAEVATEKIIAVFKDRWSIDQEDGWAEFGPDTIDDVRRIVEEAITEQRKRP